MTTTFEKIQGLTGDALDRVFDFRMDGSEFLSGAGDLAMEAS